MEHVVQFETKRKTSPGFDMQEFYLDESREIRKEACTGAAWLSSARSVRSALKWDNERNPYSVLKLSQKTAPDLSGRREGQTSSQHGPYTLGYTHVTMDNNNEFCQSATTSKPLKFVLSWD